MARVQLKRAEQVTNRKVDAVHAIDPEFEREYPTVYAFVMQDRYEDGGYRQTATLLFFLDQGGLKVCLNDRDGARCLFRTGGSITGCIAALEEALTNDTADWKAKRI